MPFNGSGIFQRTFPPGGWQGDAAAGIKIMADRHDQNDNDLANGLSNMICKDGQSTITADIPWNSHKITGLSNPVSPQDAATKNYVDGMRNFSTAIVITGSHPEAQLRYTGLTGPWGQSYVAADVAAGVRGTSFIFNDKADFSGTDVATITEAGGISGTAIASTNGYFTGAAGVAGLRTSAAGGLIVLQPNSNTTRQSVLRDDGILTSYGLAGETSVTSLNGYFTGAAGVAGLTTSADGGLVVLRPNNSATNQATLRTDGSLEVVSLNSNTAVTAYGGYSNTGARDAVSVLNGSTRSSATLTTARTHLAFYNPNGLVGSISTTGSATAYTTSSDERLKENITAYSLEDAVAIIRADPVQSFDWKADGSPDIGWIAQRSYAVDPALAVAPPAGAEDDQWGVDYGRRTPYLWAALSAALDKIDALEARLSALEAVAP